MTLREISIRSLRGVVWGCPRSSTNGWTTGPTCCSSTTCRPRRRAPARGRRVSCFSSWPFHCTDEECPTLLYRPREVFGAVTRTCWSTCTAGSIWVSLTRSLSYRGSSLFLGPNQFGAPFTLRKFLVYWPLFITTTNVSLYLPELRCPTCECLSPLPFEIQYA